MSRPYAHSPILQFERMLFIRKVEEEIARRYSEQKMRCPVHLSIGQEGAAVGVCSVLEVTDQIVSNHRCHAHYLAMGGNFKAMLAEIYGKASGCAGGRGGSMHLFDNDAGIRASIPIVAGGIPLAGGIALSKKVKDEAGIAVAFFGDGAVEEGVFHETLNFAKVRNLPLLFVCENNQFSVYTGLSERQPDDNMLRYADASGIKNIRVNGSLVGEVADNVQILTDFIRKDKAPAFIQIDTYRWLEHCGPNGDDNLGYRVASETEKWKKRCPVALLQEELINKNIITLSALTEISKRLDKTIAEIFETAIKDDFPIATTAGDHVYA